MTPNCLSGNFRNLRAEYVSEARVSARLKVFNTGGRVALIVDKRNLSVSQGTGRAERGRTMGELAFGHPGPNFDDTPAGFDDRPLNYWPEPDYKPDEVVHYAPAGRPVCGAGGGWS